MRSLSQRQVLAMVLNTWHRGSAAQHFGSSIVGTAWFLWILIVVGLLVAGGLGLTYWLEHEEDCNHRAGSGADIECVQPLKGKRAKERDDVGHAGMVQAAPFHKYVHGMAA